MAYVFRLSAAVARLAAWAAAAAGSARTLVMKPCGIVRHQQRQASATASISGSSQSSSSAVEILQHIGSHQLLDAGMADAEPHPPVIGADRGVDRAQPVMARRAAAALDPELAGREVDARRG